VSSLSAKRNFENFSHQGWSILAHGFSRREHLRTRITDRGAKGVKISNFSNGIDTYQQRIPTDLFFRASTQINQTSKIRSAINAINPNPTCQFETPAQVKDFIRD
jgi:hypothetical protein